MALELGLLALSGLLAVVIILLYSRLRKLGRALEDAAFGKKSLSVRYGKMSEQFFPFLKDYPYNPQDFRFLGTPIDGVQFEDDRLVFVEFKAGDSRLSLRQQKVKELVEKGKVEFRVVRIK